MLRRPTATLLNMGIALKLWGPSFAGHYVLVITRPPNGRVPRYGFGPRLTTSLVDPVDTGHRVLLHAELADLHTTIYEIGPLDSKL